MYTSRRVGLSLIGLSLALLACAALTPAGDTPPTAAPTRAGATDAADVEPSAAASETGSTGPTAAPATSTPAPTATALPTPAPTTPPPALELVQSQTWTDNLANTRVNVLVRNPYDYPVAVSYGGGASLYSAGGTLLRDRDFYFLDGVSGGTGYLLPGETVAANACFTCEAAPLAEDWATIEFILNVTAADDAWEIVTAVTGSVTSVEFEADSPLFWFTGTVTNNSGAAVQRIALRLIVLDEAGQLVAAGEGSAWDVAAGATGAVSSYGIGQPPAGPVTYEVSALGVNY